MIKPTRQALELEHEALLHDLEILDDLQDREDAMRQRLRDIEFLIGGDMAERTGKRTMVNQKAPIHIRASTVFGCWFALCRICLWQRSYNDWKTGVNAGMQHLHHFTAKENKHQ